MKVIVFGTRGIPDILGGVETHCEELYPHLVNKFNIDVTVIGRSNYVNNKDLKEFKGVKLKTIYAPKSKAFEAIVHSFLCVLYAGLKRPYLVHVHAVGPSLVVPLARLLGLKVVMTHHGPDYERKKWGKMAKLFLKTGEWAGVKFSNKVIVISEEIKKSIAEKYGCKDAVNIPNGVSITGRPAFMPEILNYYKLERYNYIFTLGRFVPEKGFDYLIKAFKRSGLQDRYKLVIAGDADHETDYSVALKKQALEEGVILTGFIKGNYLSQLFSNCGLFILPSFYEGLPIALLEGMAYKLPILASDIPANKQVNLPGVNYFKVGDEEALALKMKQYVDSLQLGQSENYDMEAYNWANIARSVNEVYHSV